MNQDPKSSNQPIDLPGGTVTFLFTDIEGSTKLLAYLRDQYKVLLEDHRRIFRESFSRWNGHEVGTQGDSFFIAFPRASDGVNAVVEAQRALAEHSWPEDVEVRVRMGLHTGEPLEANEDYMGMDVHRAARIAHVGHGGQVLLSETTAALVMDELPEGVTLIDLGRHLLKDLHRPERIRMLKIEGLQFNFPPLTSLEKLPSVDMREPRSVGESPYRGLSSFREEDAQFFFGRESFTQNLYKATKKKPMVAVIVGSSGSGKSSAVFAGLLPRLREEDSWLVIGLRPGGEPFQSIASVLLPLLEPGLDETERLIRTRKLGEALSTGEIPLVDVLERVLEIMDGAKRLLLFVDQFEEVYTLCTSADLRRRFKDALLSIVQVGSGTVEPSYVLLLTMRADFMGQALTHRPFADALQEASLLMGPMTREELRDAVERPAKIQGAVFEAGLVERILDDVGEEPGNLPLLEFALTLLWETQDDGWLTHTAYEKLGCVEGALAVYADEVYRSLDEGNREKAQKIFVQLVKPGEGTEDTRRLATRTEVGADQWDLVQHLADKRLVVTDRDAAGNEILEVVHEALIQSWGLLRGWMEADRAFRIWQERLRANRQVWQKNDKDEGALLRGAPLAEAEGWFQDRENEMSPGEIEYIQASIALRKRRQAEAEKRRRWAFLALGGGLTAALVLVGIAFNQRGIAQNNALVAEHNAATATHAQGEAIIEAATAEAERARAEVEANARGTQQALAESESLARATAQAQAEFAGEDALRQAAIGLASQAELQMLGPNPERSVLLALEAVENYPYTWQAEHALGQAVLNHKLLLELFHGAQSNSAELSPDGTKILTGGSDGKAIVWDYSTGEGILNLETHAGIGFMQAHWSPSGDRILTHGVSGITEIWDGTTGDLLHSLSGHGGYYADWSPDGTKVHSSYSFEHDSVMVWDANTGEALFSLPGHTGLIKFAMWSPDGTRIITSIGKIFDAQSGEELVTLSAYQDQIDNRLQMLSVFSPDGLLLAGGFQGGGPGKIWDSLTGEELFEIAGHSGIFLTHWSPSGDRFVTVGLEDDLARIWDVASGKELHTLQGTTGFDGFWSPDGTRILTSGEKGDVIVWDSTTGSKLLTIHASTREVSFLEWFPSGDRIITTDAEGNVKVWDVSETLPSIGCQPDCPFSYYGGWSTDVAWSPSGDQVVRGYADGTITVWKAENGEDVLQIKFESDIGGLLPSAVQSVSWSPQGSLLLSTHNDGKTRVWDSTSGELLKVLIGGEELQEAASDERNLYAIWSPDGSKILIANGKEGISRVWDAENWELLITFDEHIPFTGSWSPDGSRIITADKNSETGSAKIWQATTGELMLDLFDDDFTYGVTGVAWSPDGIRIVTFSTDGLGRIWNADSGEELLVFSGLSSVVGPHIDWSPSGDRILTSGQGGEVKVWDGNTGRELLNVEVGGDSVSASWAPDGEHIAISDWDGNLRIIPAWLSLEKLIDYASDCCVIRELTPEERVQFGLPPQE